MPLNSPLKHLPPPKPSPSHSFLPFLCKQSSPPPLSLGFIEDILLRSKLAKQKSMFMSQEDVCDTGLALGLGHGGRSTTATSHAHSHHNRRPSLTLSLSDDTHRPVTARLSSPHSIVSSFCPIKREKDMMMEEAEMEEEDDGSARKKLRLTKEQSSLLEDRFKEHSTLNPKQKQALAKQLNLRPRQVEVWFQNRRARTKLKQTEVDCEFLKRCCETLSDENRRLQKELKELRALKSVHQPLYMPATLTMCPSCERIGGRGDSTKGAAAGRGGGGHFVVAATSKPRFFNPFTHPAAC